MAEGLIIRNVHLYKKENFGNITPVEVERKIQNSSTYTFNGSGGNALYILVAGKDAGLSDGPTYVYITNVTTGGSTRLLYSSKGDSTISTSGACVVVGMKSSSDTCTVTFSTSSGAGIVLARVGVSDAKIEVVNKTALSTVSEGNFTRQISMSNAPTGSLYVGAASVGSHWATRYLVPCDENGKYTRSSFTNCGGSAIVSEGDLGWNKEIISTFVPTAATNSFSVGVAGNKNASGYALSLAAWMFKVYKNY